MFFHELKRRLFTKFTLFSIIAILLLTIILNVIIIKDDPAIHQRIQEEAIYCGEITEDNLLLALKKVRDEKSPEAKYVPLMDFLIRFIKDYPGLLYYKNRVQDYPDFYADQYYDCLQKKSAALIEKTASRYKEKAMKELSKVKTPFVYYAGYFPWVLSIDNLQVVYMLILFLVTFFGASTYSDSIEDGSMAIIASTRHYKKMMTLRLLPIVIYGLILTLTATLSTILVLGSITGLKALKSSFKVYALFSIGNFTLGQGILLMFLSEILGVLALSTITGFISYKIRKTNLAASIGIAINVIYFILNSSSNSSPQFIQNIINILPLASSQVINYVSGYQFNMGIWRPYAVIVDMLVLFISFGILLKLSFNKSET